MRRVSCSSYALNLKWKVQENIRACVLVCWFCLPQVPNLVLHGSSFPRKSYSSITMTACFCIGHARSTCWVFVVAKQFGIRLCPFLFGLMCFFVMLLWILFVWLVWAPCLGFGSFSNHCFRKLLVFFFWFSLVLQSCILF